MQMIPVMLCFFTLGFVDLVGTASNFVQQDLVLTDLQANLLPSLVFFFSLIFIIPAGMLMHRIGRKNAVMVSLVVTAISLSIPAIGDGYITMSVSFSLLGIGNAIMQTSLNPLVTNIIGGDKLASTLTLCQFIKAIASFLAPLIATWGATACFPTFGMGWKALFMIYAVISLLSVAALATTPIDEDKPDRISGIGEYLSLLGHPFLLLCFLGIVCHVGIDIGTNLSAPKILMERIGLPLEEAGIAASVYFLFRLTGYISGVFILRSVPPKIFFALCVVLMLTGLGILAMSGSISPIYLGIALIGFGNSNIFAIVYSQAIVHSPSEINEISRLMIMGLSGGIVFPLAMGYASDAVGQAGAIAVMVIAIVYLMFYTMKIKPIQ